MHIVANRIYTMLTPDSKTMNRTRDLKTDRQSILRLNVGGKSYLVSKATALRHSGSLLAALANGNDRIVPLGVRMSVYILKETGEYFVERSPLLFDVVLQYARTGRIQCPAHVCQHALREELAFWKLKDDDTERRRRRVQTVMEAAGSVGEAEEKEHKGCMDQLWRLFEYPKSSKMALVISGLCILFVVVSIINFVISTDPALRSSCMDDDFGMTATAAKTTPHFICQRSRNDWWFDMVEAVCTAWFALEFSLRLISCPQKLKFVRSPLNVIDFLATVPFCVEMIAYATVGGGRYINSRDSGAVAAILILMRVFRVLRIIRSFRSARYTNSFQLLCALAWNSRGDFGLLLLFLSVGTLIFSCLMYYAERDESNTAYTSILATFWWCVVTFSTVGYGDVTPTTTEGRIIAGIACMSGILIITFPISIITDTFRCTYEAHEMQRRRRRGLKISREQRPKRCAVANTTTVATVKEDYKLFHTKL